MIRDSKPQRIYEKLVDDMRNTAVVRVGNGLALPLLRDTSMKEMTRLLTKTEGYRLALEELKIRPKKQ